MKVKNLILDLGGVILDVNYDAAAMAFNKWGFEFAGLYSKQSQSLLFDDFEKGTLTEAQFRTALRSFTKQALTDEMIDDGWNKMLGTIPASRMNFLISLRTHYKVFLLSNTNKIHIKSFTESINKQYGAGAFENLFDKIYFSCELNMRKPDAEIFHHVIKENKLNVNETVFIDDSEHHVKGAIKAGLKSFHIDLLKYKLEDFIPVLKL